MKLANLGGVSPTMPNFSDVTPKLSPIPNINPKTYGSSIGSAASGLSSLFGFANISNPLGWASLGANVLGNILNHSSASNAQKLQLKMFKEQLKFNHDEAQLAFDREAKYNSEVSQVARMRAAGLNPALMFKGADSVNSSVASAPSAPDLKYPLLDSQLGSNGISALLQGTDLLSRNESNKAMINQLRSLSAKYGTDSKYQGMLNNLLSVTFDNEVQDKALKNVETKARIETYRAECAKMAAEKLLISTQAENYCKELGIKQESVVNALKAAILNAKAVKYSADKASEASKYSSDNVRYVGMENAFINKERMLHDFEYQLKIGGIEEDKARSMRKYFDSQADLNSVQEFFYPVTALGSFLSSGLMRGVSSVPTISGFSMSH